MFPQSVGSHVTKLALLFKGAVLQPNNGLLPTSGFHSHPQPRNSAWLPAGGSGRFLLCRHRRRHCTTLCGNARINNWRDNCFQVISVSSRVLTVTVFHQFFMFSICFDVDWQFLTCTQHHQTCLNELNIRPVRLIHFCRKQLETCSSVSKTNPWL